MRLYPKKLNSLEELKREKQVLKYARKHSKPEGFMDMIPKPSAKEDKQSDILSFAGDLLTSRSTIDTLMTLGLPMLKLVGRKTEKSFLKTVVGEVFGGYIKWKVLQMGVRGVRLLVHMQKEKAKKKEAPKGYKVNNQEFKKEQTKKTHPQAEYSTH
ncbi:hypothetical protein [Polluticoccus soli]|uniref:hypothetical protein n=1 Tax=Polluticoccus soli TaxID=3034150 RepID=UPI0023E0BEAB|nr:hypothetical protein [Flavipsychrobacter sp. JY13-12]